MRRRHSNPTFFSKKEGHMNQKAVVIFDPVSSGTPLKETAHAMGFKVIGAFTQSFAFFQENYHVEKEELFKDCDEIIHSSDLKAILEQLRNSSFSIKGVIAGTEQGVEYADQIAHFLNLPCNQYELFKARRDKGEMRKVLKESGLTCPGFIIAQSEEEALQFAQSHIYPIVVKTPKGAMTSQVYVCEDLKSVLTAFREIFGKKDLYGHLCKGVVIEEYVSGPEYIVDTFSDGNTIHIMDTWQYEKIEVGGFKNVYYNSFLIPANTIKHIIDYALKISSIYGIKLGVAHLEIKDDPIRGPTLIEINARLPGGRLPTFVKKFSNFDPYRATIEVFTKGKTIFPQSITFSKYCAIASCPLTKKGEIIKIHGLEEIQKLPSYDSHVLSLHIGDVVEPSTHLGTIPLRVSMAHSELSQLQTDIKKAHELFHVDLVDL